MTASAPRANRAAVGCLNLEVTCQNKTAELHTVVVDLRAVHVKLRRRVGSIVRDSHERVRLGGVRNVAVAGCLRPSKPCESWLERRTRVADTYNEIEVSVPILTSGVAGGVGSIYPEGCYTQIYSRQNSVAPTQKGRADPFRQCLLANRISTT